MAKEAGLFCFRHRRVCAWYAISVIFGSSDKPTFPFLQGSVGQSKRCWDAAMAKQLTTIAPSAL
jgi:hypothetical protein